MVNNLEAQDWLDKKYPIDKACKRDNDSENKGKKRAGITKLDIRKGSLGKHFYSMGDGDKNLVGSLKLEGFTNLRTLIVSSHQLIELDVSDCPSLEELDCCGNQLTSLNVNNCSNLEKINCSNNNIKKLELGTCSKLKEINCDFNKSLKEVDVSNCLDFTKTGSNFTHDIENGKLVKVGPQIVKVKENDVRNVLVIGITGNGKSALANVLSNTTVTNEFKEGDASTSVTKNFQKSDIIKWQGKKYRIIDNIGFGDTNNINEEDILFKIGDGIHSAREGINQVFFVFKGRFAPEHIKVFNMFKDFIDEAGITKFTTLIRTNFVNFRNQEKCQEDKDALFNEGNKELSAIVSSCNGIIYVDNPSNNERSREKSREKVLNHLVDNCQNIYKLKEWDSISSKVENYIKRKEELENSSSSTKDEELSKIKTEVAQGVKKELEASIGVNVPGFPVGFNAAFKYKVN